MSYHHIAYTRDFYILYSIYTSSFFFFFFSSRRRHTRCSRDWSSDVSLPISVERLLGLLAGETAAREVDQDQVGVGSAGDEPEAACQERRGERLRVLHDLLLVLAPRGAERLLERDRLRRDDVHQGSALDAGHHGLVEGLGVLGPAHDHPAARPAQRLVRRGRDEVGNADR